MRAWRDGVKQKRYITVYMDFQKLGNKQMKF